MLLRDATLADGRRVDVRVADERIAAVGSQLRTEGDEAVREVGGRLLLPGAIDVHVHFREPGFPHKETWVTGSRAAAAGGVTTVVDQPNTSPPTVDGAAFEEKAALAVDSQVDYGLNGGVTTEWDPDSLFERPLFALGEVFLADSTGEMGIDGSLFRTALARAAAEGVPVTVHAEDADRFDEEALPARGPSGAADGPDRGDGEGPPEWTGTGGYGRGDAATWSDYRPADAEITAVERALATAAAVTAETGGEPQLHVAHTSTPEAVQLATDAGATCEVTPHHLLLSRADLEDLGTLGRMNPPLRSEQRRAALFDLLADGTVDVVATDHAPHTLAEKDAHVRDAPSGVPGVETMLPLLLERARRGALTYERVRDVVAAAPARIFDLPRKGRIAAGADADLVLVDPDDAREIRGEALHSKCGWTPFEDRRGVFPEWTMVRGEVVYEAGTFGEPAGANVRE